MARIVQWVIVVTKCNALKADRLISPLAVLVASGFEDIWGISLPQARGGLLSVRQQHGIRWNVQLLVTSQVFETRLSTESQPITEEYQSRRKWGVADL